MLRPTSVLRAELTLLRVRYDSGAVSAAIYNVIRQLEIDIAWAEHAAARISAVVDKFPILVNSKNSRVSADEPVV